MNDASTIPHPDVKHHATAQLFLFFYFFYLGLHWDLSANFEAILSFIHHLYPFMPSQGHGGRLEPSPAVLGRRPF